MADDWFGSETAWWAKHQHAQDHLAKQGATVSRGVEALLDAADHFAGDDERPTIDEEDT
jgi:hypothetical protein